RTTVTQCPVCPQLHFGFIFNIAVYTLSPCQPHLYLDLCLSSYLSVSTLHLSLSLISISPSLSPFIPRFLSVSPFYPPISLFISANISLPLPLTLSLSF